MPRHRVLTPLRWSDMDAYGHVNNVQFLRLLEEARVITMAAIRTYDRSLVETGLLVARAEIEYLEPLVFRTAPVAIDLWITALAGASFTVGYEVLDDATSNGGKPTIYARAETTMVVYDLAGEHPRRLSPEEKAQLESWRDEPVPFRWRSRAAR